MRCRWVSNATQCDRKAKDGWTTCPRHYTGGMNRKVWERIRKQSVATRD